MFLKHAGPPAQHSRARCYPPRPRRHTTGCVAAATIVNRACTVKALHWPPHPDPVLEREGIGLKTAAHIVPHTLGIQGG